MYFILKKKEKTYYIREKEKNFFHFIILLEYFCLQLTTAKDIYKETMIE